MKSLHADPWPGNPPLRVHETAAGMINSRGAPGPRRRGLARPRSGGTGGHGCQGGGVDLGTHDRRVPPRRRPDGGRSRQRHRPRGQPVVPQHRGGARPVRALRRRHPGGHGGDRRLRPSPLGQAQSERRPPGRDRRRCTRCRSRGGDARQHRHGDGDRPGDAALPPGIGARGGGLSGPAIHPIAVRAVFDVHRVLPELPIVGVGGVASGADAAELLLAGASAVQVGTATFADPRAPHRVLRELQGWAARQGVAPHRRSDRRG